MTMKYAGKLIPKVKRSPCYRQGRLPESERAPGEDGMAAAGWRKLNHSTEPEIRHGSAANSHAGEYMRRLNKMFAKIANLPEASRKGREGKDLSQDKMFKALKEMPNDGGWYAYADDNGQPVAFASGKDASKVQSRIAAMAKAGAGTFKTTFRGEHVFIQKIHDEYVKRRNA